MDVYFPTGQVAEAYCQSYNGVVQNQEPVCIRIAQSKPRSQANQESGPRLKLLFVVSLLELEQCCQEH